MLIVFDDMVADIMTNKKFQAVTEELFIRCRKLSKSLVFITQSSFSFAKFKNIEDQNKEQFNEIEYQGERQFDMIDKH